MSHPPEDDEETGSAGVPGRAQSPRGDPPGALRPAVTGIAALGVPMAVALLFAAVLVLQGTGEPAYDLHVFVPSQAPAGRRVAVRALLFTGVDRRAPPELGTAPVRLRLRDGDGERVATAELGPSELSGMEGHLHVPEGAEGRHSWVATAEPDAEGAVQTEGLLRVSAEPDPARRRGRLLSPLQQYTAFAVRPVEGEQPPSALHARIAGGACRPEQRCDVLVWVGRPAAEVTVEGTPAVEPLGQANPQETAGIVRLPIVVHGAEADLHLVARRQGRVVARRTVRLPVDQAMPVLRVDNRVPAGPLRPWIRLQAASPQRAYIVDAFRSGRWERTGSHAAEALRQGAPVPFPELDPGPWRLQLRSDPFSTGSAATRLIWVRHPGRTDAEVLEAVARMSVRRGWNDPFAGAVLDGRVTPGESLPRAVAFLMAAGELELVEQPRALSSYEQGSPVRSSRERTWRLVAAAMVVLVGIAVGVFLLRRGLRASAEARELMAEAGDVAARQPERRRRMTLSVAAGAAFLLLVFVAVAAMIAITRWQW